ncbi:hypothetical protein PG988_008310 [Apiospora saccharicola]
MKQIHTPDTGTENHLSGSKSNCVKPANSTAGGHATAHDGATGHGNSTAATKSKAGNSTKAVDTAHDGGMTCNCSGSGGAGTKVGSGSGSMPGNSTGGNSTKGVVRAAGHTTEAANAGGLVTLAGLGVAFVLFM